MKLSRYTDYALRVLIYLAARDEGLASIRQIAGAYAISHNHLMKIVQDLGHAGFVETVRGRGGGLRLARPASAIVIGEVVRHTEDLGDLVDCNTCRIALACGLPPILAEANEAFLAVLDRYCLSDVAARPETFFSLFQVLPDAAVDVNGPASA